MIYIIYHSWSYSCFRCAYYWNTSLRYCLTRGQILFVNEILMTVAKDACTKYLALRSGTHLETSTYWDLQGPVTPSRGHLPTPGASYPLQGPVRLSSLILGGEGEALMLGAWWCLECQPHDRQFKSRPSYHLVSPYWSSSGEGFAAALWNPRKISGATGVLIIPESFNRLISGKHYYM
jgi:hypothetical protein